MEVTKAKQGLVLKHVGAAAEDPVDLSGHWRGSQRTEHRLK